MQKRLKRIFSALVCLVLLTGCASAGEETQQGESVPFTTQLSGKILQSSAAADDIFSVNYDPEGDFNPIRADNGTNMLLTPLMYDCVFNVDSDFSFYSNVVTNYTTEDNEWWVFTVDTTIPFIDSTTHGNKAKIDKLIGEKIQLFDNLSPVSDNTYTFKIHSANTAA